MDQTPMFPLESAVLPGEALTLRIFEPRYLQLVQTCLAAPEPVFGTVLIARGREVGGGDIRSDVGALAHIDSYEDQGGGQYQLRAVVQHRIRVTQWLPDGPYPRANVKEWPDESGASVDREKIDEIAARIVALYQRVVDVRGGNVPPNAFDVAADADAEPSRYVYEWAAKVPMGAADRYTVLAAPTLAERVEALTDAIETVSAMLEFQLRNE